MINAENFILVSFIKNSHFTLNIESKVTCFGPPFWVSYITADTKSCGVIGDGIFAPQDLANTEPTNDSKNMLSAKEAAFRSHHRLYWSNYIRSRRTRREAAALRRFSLVLDDTTDCRDLHNTKLPAIKEPSMAFKMLTGAMDVGIVDKPKDEMLVPLSPLRIYNVKIYPTVLAYGLVSKKFCFVVVSLNLRINLFRSIR